MELQMIPTNWQKRDNIIKVIGVGGGGGNAVAYMFQQELTDIDFAVCNTDLQALEMNPVQEKIQLGAILTKGLGAGTDNIVGKKAAEESLDDIQKLFHPGTEMVFVTCGMGGGTGTGGAPVVANTAKQKGLLTVGVVTIPFRDEGEEALYRAVQGVKELSQQVDSILIIDNQKLYDIYPDLDVFTAFDKANEVLCTAVRSIADIITKGGHINTDFADVRKIMQNSGVSMIGIGMGSGKDRVTTAVDQAIGSPLLNNLDLTTAKRALVNITTSSENGKAASMTELSQIMDLIKSKTGNMIHFKRGIVKDDKMGDSIMITIIATGFEMTQLPMINVRRENTIEVRYDEIGDRFRKTGMPLCPDEESHINNKARLDGKPSLIVDRLEDLQAMEDEPAFYRRERLIKNRATN